MYTNPDPVEFPTIPEIANAMFSGGLTYLQANNNNANIRRIKQRIEQLERVEAAPEHPPVEGEGWRIWEDRDENRLFICHDSKPSAEVRTHLKRHGFRWNRYAGAWSRMLNGAAWANAEYLAEQGKLDL